MGKECHCMFDSVVRYVEFFRNHCGIIVFDNLIGEWCVVIPDEGVNLYAGGFKQCLDQIGAIN